MLGGQATDFFDIDGDLIDANEDSIPDAVQTTPPAPNSSDDYIVTQTVYNPRLSAAGPIVDTIDNAGRIAEPRYDLAGRTVATIQNYDDGTVEETDTDKDVTTIYQYDSFDRLVTLTAIDAKGDGEGIVNEQTRYLYESPDNALLQAAVVSPDLTDVLSQDQDIGDWTITTDNGDHTSTTYDWQGRATSATDQRGVVHADSYDSAGRLAADTVTSLGLTGQNVDGTVRQIGCVYDDLGREQSVTSYSDTDGTVVVNQDVFAYDGWGNRVRDWQANDGAVNTSTTPSVQYVYDDGAISGVAKYVRLTDVIYPNGRDVVYGYGEGGSTDDVLSRVSTIGDGTTTYAAYRYLGVNGIASEDYQEPQVKLDYSADNFAALDLFGRVADQVWSAYGENPAVLDEYTYTFDRAGNVTARANATDTALSELFGYDSLNQVTSAARGDSRTQDWTLDGLGNWSGFDDNGASQTRQTNAANEITSATGLATPVYDRAGDAVSTPNPGSETTSLTCTYDA